LKLHSPSFERDLRRCVKKAVRESPELKKEYRQAKKAIQKHIRINWILRPVLSLVLGYAVWFMAGATRHSSAALAPITLWSVCLWSILTRNLLLFIFRAGDLQALTLLPISDSAMFRWELQKAFRKFAFPVLLDLLAGFGALGLYFHFANFQWIAIALLAALSWAMLLALSAFSAARLPTLRYPVITSSLVILGYVLLFTVKLQNHVVLDLIDGAAPTFNLLLPTGWCPSLFELLLTGRTWLVASLMIPIGLVMWTTKDSLKLLQSKMVFREYPAPDAPDQIPGESPAGAIPSDGDAQGQPLRAGITHVEEIVQSRQFLLQVPWAQRGWFENLLWKWLDPRERTLADFVFPTGFSITKPWIGIARNFLLAVVLGFAAGSASSSIRNWIFGIGLFVTFSQALAQILANGAAFRGMACGGVIIPIYAAYPIEFRKLSSLLFKCSLIQLPMLVPFAMAWAALIAQFAVANFAIGLLPGFKAGFLLLACRFIFVALAFSNGTNDTAAFRIRAIALIVAFMGLGALFLGLAGTGLFLPRQGVAWLLWALALVDAYALFRVYGWFYHANRFDLMKVPR
jgi:hypothetical protein